MKNYESPELKVTLFKGEEVLTASSGEATTTKGPGGGVVLPDDDWF